MSTTGPSREPVTVIAELRFDPAHREALLELARSMSATRWRPSRSCLRFELVAPKDDPGSLVFYEMFASDAAFAAHRGLAHSTWFRDARAPVRASKPRSASSGRWRRLARRGPVRDAGPRRPSRATWRPCATPGSRSAGTTVGRILTEAELIERLDGVVATVAGLEPYTERVFAAAPGLKVVARMGVGSRACRCRRRDPAWRRRRHGVRHQSRCRGRPCPGADRGRPPTGSPSTIGGCAAEAGAPCSTAGCTRPRSGWSASAASDGRSPSAVWASTWRCWSPTRWPTPTPWRGSAIAWSTLDELLRRVRLRLAARAAHGRDPPSDRRAAPRPDEAHRHPGQYRPRRVGRRGGARRGACRAAQLAGAALDVFETEPLPDGALRRLEQVVLTPHVGGVSAASLQAMAARCATTSWPCLRGRDPGPGLVLNPEVLPAQA